MNENESAILLRLMTDTGRRLHRFHESPRCSDAATRQPVLLRRETGGPRLRWPAARDA